MSDNVSPSREIHDASKLDHNDEAASSVVHKFDAPQGVGPNAETGRMTEDKNQSSAAYFSGVGPNAEMGRMTANNTEASITIGKGMVNVAAIEDARKKLEKLVETYYDINRRVNDTTTKVKENWKGKGANEFEVQYQNLINKIDDFGVILKEVFENLVNAEIAYSTVDEEAGNNLKSQASQFGPVES